MNFYKLTKLFIYCLFGFLLACTPTKQQLTAQHHGSNGNSSENNTTETTNQNSIEIGISPDTKKELKEKESTTPGGGIYIKMPAS